MYLIPVARKEFEWMIFPSSLRIREIDYKILRDLQIFASRRNVLSSIR